MTALKIITKEEVESMLRNWANDPCFDLPIKHPQYSKFRTMMQDFHDRQQAKWAEAEQKRMEAACTRYGVPFDRTIATVICGLERQIELLGQRLEKHIVLDH